MPDGGMLGFSCQHQYVFQDLNSSNDLPCILNGADNVIYMSGRSLGLQVSVRPVIDSSPNYSERFYLGTIFHADCYYIDHQDDKVLMRGLLKDEIENDDNITWCLKVSNFNLKPVGEFVGEFFWV